MQGGALEAAQVQVAIHQGVLLNHGEQLNSAAAACGQHHLTNAAAVYRREQRRRHGGHGVAGQAQAIQAALELAQVLHARDDFLAGVAALLEADAADGLQVDHLRDQLFAGGAEHLAYAGTHLSQQPVVERRFAQLCGQRRQHSFGLGGGGPEFAAAIAETHGEHVACVYHAVRRGRQVQAEAGQHGIAALQTGA